MFTAEQVEVYRQSGRFAGWPANYGMWCWGEEIVLGFLLGYSSSDPKLFHTRDTSRPFVTMQARSLDAGRTWTTAPMPCATPAHLALSTGGHVTATQSLDAALDDPQAPHRPTPCPGDLDFTHPDFAYLAACSGLADGSRSFFYLSNDRCRHWYGPYEMPMFGQRGVSARSDMQVLGPHDMLLFLTAAKPDGKEGRAFCARTRDGGVSFEFVALIGPDIEGDGWDIMPASLRLPNGELLVALRRGRAVGGNQPWRHWIDLYRSTDEGRTWQLGSTPVASTGINGNPPTLHALPDGRLVMTYGHRDEPRGIYAVLSEDQGRTWCPPLALRTGAGAPDLGYTRTVVTPAGAIVTAYYLADSPLGERYIAATRWTPPARARA